MKRHSIINLALVAFLALDSFGANKKSAGGMCHECCKCRYRCDCAPWPYCKQLLTNTIKYAFPDGRSGKVQIKLEQASNGALQMQISDDGVGKGGVTHGTGFGGQLISLLTQQLGGTMKEEIDNGTHIFFEFKSVKAA